MSDHTACVIGKNRLAEVLDDLIFIPAVMRLFARGGFEAHGGMRDRAAALECLTAHEISIHDQTLRAGRATVNPVSAGAPHCIFPSPPGTRLFLGAGGN